MAPNRVTVCILAMAALLHGAARGADGEMKEASKADEKSGAVTVALSADPAAWKVGEAITVSCTVHNTSDSKVAVMDWGVLGLVTVLGAGDKKPEVLFSGADASRRLRAGDFVVLDAGASKTFKRTLKLQANSDKPEKGAFSLNQSLATGYSLSIALNVGAYKLHTDVEVYKPEAATEPTDERLKAAGLGSVASNAVDVEVKEAAKK